MGAVLQAKDVGRLARLTENAVKQWTIGRPYAIRPSIRLSSGKGMPNLYDLTDALRFAVAINLTADGFQSRVIQRVLESFDVTANTVLITRNRIEFSRLPLLRCARQEEAETRRFVNRSFYLLDLESLREALNDNWEQMLNIGLQDRKQAREGKQQKAKTAKR